MAWETRGGRRYYYRKVWKDGRCFSVYEGGGPLAELKAGRDEESRETAQRRVLDTRAALAALDAVDAMIDRDWQTAKAAAEATLEAAGYHRHKRQWRLKRDAKAN
jgi:hypothetical protein